MTNVIIIGGGKVGIRLIQLLKKRESYNITLIDSNKKLIDYITKLYEEHVMTICGDATNRSILEKAGIKTADIIVAATSNDEINLLIGILSQDYDLKKTIARTANPSHIKMFKKLGLNEVVSPELTACSDIEKLIIHPNVADLAMTGKGDCELIELPVRSKKVIGKEIGELSPNENFIIIMCSKNNNILIAKDNIILNKEDKVTVLVKRKAVKKTKKLFLKNGFII